MKDNIRCPSPQSGSIGELAAPCALAALESIRDGVLIVDRELRVRYVSARARALLIADGEDPLGRRAAAAFPQLREGRFQVFGEQCLAEDRRLSFEVGSGAPGGALEVHLEPSDEGVVITLQLLEERRRLEAQLQQSAKLESMGTMAGGIAHDFNNLLVGIIGNADLAASQLEEGSELRLLLDDVLMAANKAAELSRKMLHYAGRRRLDLGLVGLGELLQRTAAREARVAVEVEGELPPLRVDAGQVEQAVAQLLANAKEACAGAQCKVSVRLSRYEHPGGPLTGCALHEDLEAGTYASVEVRDQGPGIPEGHRLRIFDPFFSTKFTGRGLGLAIVLSTARAHGGAVAVESDADAGTRVRLLLPLAEETASEPRVAKRLDARRVLLVDDEEAVRLAVGRMLKRIGVPADLAVDGVEGLELFREDPERYACVILDVTMPRMDGPEALKALREVSQDVPVLLSSGYAQESVEGRLGDLRADGFLRKPFRLRDLRQALGPLMIAPEASA